MLDSIGHSPTIIPSEEWLLPPLHPSEKIMDFAKIFLGLQVHRFAMYTMNQPKFHINANQVVPTSQADETKFVGPLTVIKCRPHILQLHVPTSVQNVMLSFEPNSQGPVTIEISLMTMSPELGNDTFRATQECIVNFSANIGTGGVKLEAEDTSSCNPCELTALVGSIISKENLGDKSLADRGQGQMDHLGLAQKGGECPAGCLRVPCSSVVSLHHSEVFGVEGARSWRVSCVSGSVLMNGGEDHSPHVKKDSQQCWQSSLAQEQVVNAKEKGGGELSANKILKCPVYGIPVFNISPPILQTPKPFPHLLVVLSHVILPSKIGKDLHTPHISTALPPKDTHFANSSDMAASTSVISLVPFARDHGYIYLPGVPTSFRPEASWYIPPSSAPSQPTQLGQSVIHLERSYVVVSVSPVQEAYGSFLPAPCNIFIPVSSIILPKLRQLQYNLLFSTLPDRIHDEYDAHLASLLQDTAEDAPPSSSLPTEPHS
ncbi:hypothetical protein F5J12DRAFT_915488 [Pisolithus orientalis]|uniref:uncharacterized protein n=1 Tax=Pisolithus orientalis TaxID=936130 RepID=UPI002224B40D|nr:uncharacterized protein F5J12DRAFT_915488 [Pisolithus orientalis]KAI5992354.1 hypothetical protein F5J12DRAFT_915488 [Pisolithus orientalis]